MDTRPPPYPPQARPPSPFHELDDSEWDLIAVLHPSGASGVSTATARGRPAADPRAVVNAALWRLFSGTSWLTLPTHYPSPSTCRRRYEQWLADGTWHSMAECLGRGGRTVPGANNAPAQPSARATFCSALMG